MKINGKCLFMYVGRTRGYSMRFLCTLCFAMLTISTFAGCGPPNFSRSSSENYPYSRSIVLRVKLTDMPGVITSVCDKLGISIEETTEEAGQYEVDCKSMTGLDVNFRATAVVKDKSILLTTTKGEERTSRILCAEISDAIPIAARDYLVK